MTIAAEGEGHDRQEHQHAQQRGELRRHAAPLEPFEHRHQRDGDDQRGGHRQEEFGAGAKRERQRDDQADAGHQVSEASSRTRLTATCSTACSSSAAAVAASFSLRRASMGRSLSGLPAFIQLFCGTGVATSGTTQEPRMPSLSDFPIARRWPAAHPDRLQLYSVPTPNGVKVSIMLEEIGLPYEPHRIAFGDDGTSSEPFLSLNPNGKIPAILDPDGPGGEPLGAVGIGRDPALPRRQDRPASARRSREALRNDPMAVLANVGGRADVRAGRLLQPASPAGSGRTSGRSADTSAKQAAARGP